MEYQDKNILADIWINYNWGISMIGKTLIQLYFIAYIPQKLLEKTITMQKECFLLRKRTFEVCFE